MSKSADKLRATIKKLLRLGRGTGPEAEAARERAQALMTKHNIEVDIAEDDTVAIEFVGLAPWEESVLLAASSLRPRSILLRGMRGDKRISRLVQEARDGDFKPVEKHYEKWCSAIRRHRYGDNDRFRTYVAGMLVQRFFPLKERPKSDGTGGVSKAAPAKTEAAASRPTDDDVKAYRDDISLMIEAEILTWNMPVVFPDDALAKKARALNSHRYSPEEERARYIEND